ncbi:uncharacterized protein LOC126906945 isoform X1 [Daktulosphaira vitifoliae]|uniref:uncharacterized protein LOC126906945 isoform X1 n=2 Tax=Daktulosphaira vitifoliae TaxID=58002 RepID=UPI0021AABDBA|nr:uncharacterized protein LOC126906945 isoform X1 [Daktulosphaira vitifoliae]
MISLKLAKFGFILLSVILYIKAYSILKDKHNQFNKLLQYSGWRNLNELIFIKHTSKMYYLQNLIKTTKDRNKSKQKIRCLTVYLGCTYANVINNLFSIISNMIQICQKKMNEENDLINGCLFTEELINIISLLIVPLATLMKRAMDDLDLLHIKPLALQIRTYMISPHLGKIENELGDLTEQILSRNDISSYIWILNTLDKFLKNIMIDINYDTSKYCKFVPFDTNYLWNEWNQEYKTVIDQGFKLIFFKFLTKKMKNYIQTVIIQKYFQLGFKFDPITEETFVPTPKELIKLELEFKATDEEPPMPISIETH